MKATDLNKRCFTSESFFKGKDIVYVLEYLRKLNPSWKCTSTTYGCADFELNHIKIEGMGTYDLSVVAHFDDNNMVDYTTFDTLKY